jgi:hypothetical protein
LVHKQILKEPLLLFLFEQKLSGVIPLNNIPIAAKMCKNPLQLWYLPEVGFRGFTEMQVLGNNYNPNF